jgi:hypothetical protein
MLAIKKSCGDGSIFWCCGTAGKHNPNTMKVCLGAGLYEGKAQLVRMCQNQIDNAQAYFWKSLIPMENQ